MDRCLIAGRAFWFQLRKVLWPSNLMFIYPRWEINARVWWQYFFPIARFGIARNFMEFAAMVPSSIGGSARLYFPVVAFARFSQYIFLHLFVCSRSLAIPGLPGNHHALRQWDRTTGRTIETLASWLEPGDHWWSAEYLSSLPGSKAGCIPTTKHFIGRLLPVIPACWMAQVNLGNILYKANRIPEAMDLFKQALQIKPAVAHYSLGNAFIEKGRTSEAIEEYGQALQIDPDYAEAHNNLGNAFLLTGELQRQ